MLKRFQNQIISLTSIHLLISFTLNYSLRVRNIFFYTTLLKCKKSIIIKNSENLKVFLDYWAGPVNYFMSS